MKKSFTLVELIIVIVIMGILATIAIEILLKVYKNYTITRATNNLVYQTDLAINSIASKLENRIPNSVIATECNVSDNECENGNIKGFVSIQNLSEDNAYKYPVMEWLSKDIYSKRGEWNSTRRRIHHGWSGFVDLKKTYIYSQSDEYNIAIPYSYINIIQDIDGDFFQIYGINGYNDVFENNLSVLIFSGPDGRGDFNDINHSYGWYKVLYPTNKAQKVFAIVNKDNNITIKIKAIDESNETTVYEGFFICNGANAIVPVYNKDTNDYNLTFIQNYFPWKNQKYTDGNSSLLAAHVVQFKFKEQNGLLRLYLCIQNPNINLDDRNLTICKERIVF